MKAPLLHNIIGGLLGLIVGLALAYLNTHYK